jgi:hypothetical protein
MAAAWILVATPAFAQSANGMAQNGADLKAPTQTGPAASGAAQEQRSGVSHPDPAVIRVTPYSDDDPPISVPVAQAVTPAKLSAATPKAAPTAISAAASNHRATATNLVSTGNGDAMVKGNNAAIFNPDASIVTEETAGRASRIRLSETGDAATKHYTDAGIVTRVPSRAGEVPDGTLVKVKLMQELSTLTTKPGSSFSAEVSEPVMRDGQVVVPAGSLLEGHVTLVREGSRIGPSAAIHLVPETITLPDGSQYALEARVIDTDSWDDTRVDHEGTIFRKDHGKATATTVSVSTGGGMAAGAVMGGLPGALIGAGVGAGVSTVVWMRQDRQADLPKDLGLVFCLTEPMRLTPLSARLTRPGAVGAGAE